MTDTPGHWQGQLDRNDLRKHNAPPEPLTLFNDWLDSARAADIIEPSAMTLATVDPDGMPSARIVLLKGHDEDGFRFYTNYNSRKGRALAAHPAAALVFWWEILERQVRITGPVDRLGPESSDSYHERRSRGSRIGAHASPQSSVIANREVLEARFDEMGQRFPDNNIPRPSHWGGYRLRPESIEFWQARHSRLHDRLRYRREHDSQTVHWTLERLAP